MIASAKVSGAHNEYFGIASSVQNPRVTHGRRDGWSILTTFRSNLSYFWSVRRRRQRRGGQKRHEPGQLLPREDVVRPIPLAELRGSGGEG
jgi:hypothetical protein